MAEYIEKKALMVALRNEITGDGDYYNGKDDMQDQIRDMVSRFPAADVAPVRHGRWLCVDTDTEQFFLCNRCKKKEYWESDYCPSCGAKMDGGAN